MTNEPQSQQNTCYILPLWPYAYGGPPASGNIRCKPSDFYVNERLGYELTGSGEHVWLQLEKIEQNTDQVAQSIAQFAGVKSVDVGYAGLKDRNAVTRQWFSVRLPGKTEPDWSQLNSDALSIVKITRNKQKLKRGALAGNRFNIIIRNFQGDPAVAESRLLEIKTNGMPNYFGLQRFGRDGQNINKAMLMFQGKRVKRHQRSLYISAVRAFLFNEIVAERLNLNHWNKGIIGDTYIFDRSRQTFQSEHADESIISRLKAHDIHIAGSLYGQGKEFNSLDAAKLEQRIFSQYAELAAGLLSQSVERSYRAIRVNVENLQWEFIDNTVLELSFNLPSGSYATALLRELIES